MTLVVVVTFLDIRSKHRVRKVLLHPIKGFHKKTIWRDSIREGKQRDGSVDENICCTSRKTCVRFQHPH